MNLQILNNKISDFFNNPKHLNGSFDDLTILLMDRSLIMNMKEYLNYNFNNIKSDEDQELELNFLPMHLLYSCL